MHIAAVRSRFRAGGIRRFAARAAYVVRRIIGVPDYDRYVAHMRRHHPAATPMAREEFIRQRLVDRYDKPGSRCC
jgi:uncharacterized short protein YbdD (DUF466 family)